MAQSRRLAVFAVSSVLVAGCVLEDFGTALGDRPDGALSTGGSDGSGATSGGTSSGGTSSGGTSSGGTSSGGTSSGGTSSGGTSSGGTSSGGTSSGGTSSGGTSSGGTSSGGTSSGGTSSGGTSSGGNGGTGGTLSTNVTCEEKSCLVEGGAFYRGEDKNYPATVSSFHLDRYEVTVGRMRAFVAAYNNWRLENPKLGAGAHPANPGTGWQSDWDKYLPATAEALREGLDCSISYSTWRDAIGTAEQESYPINCVNWYEAFAFCIWDKGGRLPTEAEWEYAAAGGSDERLYPWGNDGKDPPANCEDTDYRPDSAVGKYPDGAGRWGQLDLGGSMFEWVFDWYASPYTKPCDDCANTTATSQRVIRGGSWDFDATYLPAAKRRGNLPEERSSSIGVRCARPVPPE